MKHRVIYVGGPYTHADHNIRRERSIAGTASHGIATIERVRSGGRPG